MGSVFQHINDAALTITSPLDECHHCGRSDVPMYDYSGDIIDPELAADPDIAKQECSVDVACADCILQGNLRKLDYAIKEIELMLNRLGIKNRKALIESYNKTPDIPMMSQLPDWPICCDDWTEFQGCPKDDTAAETLPNEQQYWHHGPRSWAEEMGDLQLVPESLSDVSLFLCPTCGKKFFIWQGT